MSIVIGTVQLEFKFDDEEIRDLFGSKRTDEEVKQIADILAANLELNYTYEDKIKICRENFNDAYHDMIADIRDMF